MWLPFVKYIISEVAKRSKVGESLFTPWALCRIMALGDVSLSSLDIGEALQGGHRIEDVGSKETDNESSVLIPGLPNDLALQCLARVPRRYHLNLRCVCRKWRDMIASEYYYSLRKSLGLSEGWIYAFSRDYVECLHWHVLDPITRRWKELPGMPGDCLRRY